MSVVSIWVSLCSRNWLSSVTTLARCSFSCKWRTSLNDPSIHRSLLLCLGGGFDPLVSAPLLTIWHAAPDHTPTRILHPSSNSLLVSPAANHHSWQHFGNSLLLSPQKEGMNFKDWVFPVSCLSVLLMNIVQTSLEKWDKKPLFRYCSTRCYFIILNNITLKYRLWSSLSLRGGSLFSVGQSQKAPCCKFAQPVIFFDSQMLI